MPLEFCLVNSHVARKPNMVKMVKTERVPRVSRVRESLISVVGMLRFLFAVSLSGDIQSM